MCLKSFYRFSPELEITIVLKFFLIMDHQMQILLKKVEQFVEDSLKSKLSPAMYFHNLEHTLLVVEGVQLISRAEQMNDDERFILILAAFLHDLGYTDKYTGHEEISVMVAGDFLRKNGVMEEMIEDVQGCIAATKYPQFPTNKLEMVICDADFYHFSLPDYQDFADRLKIEWENNLNLFYSDLEWDELNLNMLSGHEYFTAYGKSVLQKKKDLNIEKLKKRIGL